MLAKGLNASPGAAVGKVYFTADDAEAHHEAGERVILVRPETSPDDLHGMIAAEGILTSRGGLVSHAAVVARGMGKPAICGAEAVKIDLAGAHVHRGRRHRAEGDVISINGTTGEIVRRRGRGDHARAERTVRHHPRLGRRAAHAEGAHQRRPSRGRAQGARVRRRGHRPLPHRAHVPRRPAPDRAAHDPRRHARRRGAALEELRAQQETDFEGILEAMDGLPVTVRLLDPPLHEFLPDHEELLVKQAKGEITADELKLLKASEFWRESNPMLGTRGCRLGIIKPGLYRMQVRALMQAAVTRAQGRRQPDRRDHDPVDRERARARSCSRCGRAKKPRRCCRKRTSRSTTSSAR